MQHTTSHTTAQLLYNLPFIAQHKAVLIIFPVNLQMNTIALKLSLEEGGRGGRRVALRQILVVSGTIFNHSMTLSNNGGHNGYLKPFYTVVHKKGATFIFPITLANIDGFS